LTGSKKVVHNLVLFSARQVFPRRGGRGGEMKKCKEKVQEIESARNCRKAMDCRAAKSGI
jgi:hypothetical protein